MSRIAIAALLGMAACHVPLGTRTETYPPAHRAAGTIAFVATQTDSIQGELLEVRDTALVVRTVDRVVLVSTSRARSMDFEDHRRRGRINDSLSEHDRQRLRLLSRYPRGIPATAMTRILAARGQTELVVMP